MLDHLLKGTKAIVWLNHRNLYLLGLITVFFGLSWSQALMSIGQFIIAGNWLIEFNFKAKWHALKSKRLLWILFSLFFLHFLGLLWTEDFSYGLKDLRIKLPLFLLPFLIGTSKQLEKKEWILLLRVYIITIAGLTLVSLAKLLGFESFEINDKRDLSIYISHIRYGLNISLAIVLSIHYRKLLSPNYKFLPLLLAAWLFSCLLLFELFTGLAVLIPALFVVILVPFIRKRRRFESRLVGGGFVLLLLLGTLQVRIIYTDYHQPIAINYEQDVLEEFSKGNFTYTVNGEPYWHDGEDDRLFKGVYVRRFIALKEIEREWNKRSQIDFHSFDRKGNYLPPTLYQYMATKGLKKDSLNLAKLSDAEIKAIENGVANYYYFKHNKLENRIYATIYEIDQYQKSGNANGHSLAMRLEFWKTALRIIQKNLAIGVGTGDIKNAFEKQYQQDNSLLKEAYRLRSHNQFLAIGVAFGFLGILLFVFYLFYPLLLKEKMPSSYWAFWIIAFLSFLTEDTLETQAGVTFFSLFQCLFLLAKDPTTKQ